MYLGKLDKFFVFKKLVFTGGGFTGGGFATVDIPKLHTEHG